MNMENVTEQEQRNMDTILSLVSNFNVGHTDILDDLIHDDFKNHHGREGLQDKAGFYEIVKTISAAFSTMEGFKVTPIHLFAKGDMVAMMDVGEGTKNGRAYRHKDIHIFRMKDGKMYEHWNSFGLPCHKDMLMKFME